MPRQRKLDLDAIFKKLRADEKKPAKAASEAPAVAHPKQNAKRSEPYRRFVASMPCCHCGVTGYSQAAHPPPTGKGIKESDDECFALCTLRMESGEAVEGCHKPFDNYELMPREAMPKVVAKWVRKTQTAALLAGKWPKAWPIPKWWKGGKK